MDEFTEGKVKKLKNLRMFKDKTDEEIIEYMQSKPEKPVKISATGDKGYDSRFNEKFNSLKDEYGVDMNDSNDTEALNLLVRHLIQLENLDKQIQLLQKQESMEIEDSRLLKNLGDVQRSLVASVSELQDRLGITRKMRKEKQVDDIPQYIAALKKKAKTFYDNNTTSIRCEKCGIEYARIWLNFPKLTTKLTAEIECWRCSEQIIYAK
jgi:DNA-directed RNA polymerase subunit RPC12/RpoP